jgi:hypothetical protein
VTATAQLPLQRQPRSSPRQGLRATETGLPLVGPAGSVESANIKTKTSYERKNKTVPARGAVQPPVGRPCNGGTQIEILKENEMMLTNHRRPRGRSPPLGQLYLTQADQSVNI